MESNQLEIGNLLMEPNFEHELLKSKSYLLTQSDATVISAVADEILRAFPQVPNACAYMASLLVSRIRQISDVPAHMVMGSLSFEGGTIFACNEVTDFTKLLSGSSDDWDGHCWAVFGDCIGEISFFRTAYYSTSHAWLRKMVIDSFGERKGFILATTDEMKRLQLEYTPKYVVTDDQLSGLVNGTLIKYFS